MAKLDFCMALEEVHAGSEAHVPVLGGLRRRRRRPPADHGRLKTGAARLAAADKGSTKSEAPAPYRIVLRSHRPSGFVANPILTATTTTTVEPTAAAAATATPVAELEAPGRRGVLASR